MNDLLAALRVMFPPDRQEHVFLVGGSVRDFLSGKANQDIDLAAALPADELARCGFRLVAGKTTVPIWFRYDTVRGKVELIQLDGDASLYSDLQRRDFTINAMAMGLSGEVVDPLGGRGDLEKNRLRACSDDAFRDDPVRIFRAFRFEAEGFRLTPDTERLIQREDWGEKLRGIPVERFSREMLKGLSGRESERFFQRMVTFNTGVDWLPELFRMPHIPAGPREYHPEGDLLTHSIQVLQRVALRTGDPLARFCAFFHDIGKLATDPALYPKHHGHDEAGFPLAVSFCNRLTLPAAYRKALSWTSRLHGLLNKWDELRDATRIRTAEQASKGGIARILPIVSMADKPGGSEPSGWGQALDVVAKTTAELGIDPDRLAAMRPENRASFILQRRVEMLRGAGLRTT